MAPADLRNTTTVAELDQWLGNRKCILWVVMPVLFALEKVENQLVQYKVEARKAKQASIFFHTIQETFCQTFRSGAPRNSAG